MTGVFTCHCSNMGMEQTPNKSQQHKLWRRKFSRSSCWDSNSQPFNYESGRFHCVIPSLCVQGEHQRMVGCQRPKALVTPLCHRDFHWLNWNNWMSIDLPCVLVDEDLGIMDANNPALSWLHYIVYSSCVQVIEDQGIHGCQQRNAVVVPLYCTFTICPL